MEYIFNKAGNGKITITLYSNHLEIRRKGFLNKFGERDDGVKFKDISKLIWEDPNLLMNGSIELVCSNKNIQFFYGRREKKEALKLKEFIDKKIAEIQGRNAERNADSALAHFDELKKLKELYDLDIITEQEYNEKKKKFLS